jgi:hypothetical protein
MDEEKNIQRVENMLYNICGCNPAETRQVLYKCLVRAEDKIRQEKKIKEESNIDKI